MRRLAAKPTATITAAIRASKRRSPIVPHVLEGPRKTGRAPDNPKATITKTKVSRDTRTTVLAIESSCDDSSVAVIDIHHDHATKRQYCVERFHQSLTADTQRYGGIHPEVALRAHIANVPALVEQACTVLRESEGKRWKPHLIAATRGPGMRANLNVGLSIAKGLALAWRTAFIGVHHMQAHALTPRYVSVSETQKSKDEFDLPLRSITPSFPYLSILVSGGHTMLLNSTDLTEHTMLATTDDVAVGDFIDKSARAILPKELCKAPYGASLERFAFPNGSQEYDYTAPKNRGEELEVRATPYHWSLRPPFSISAGDKSSRRMAFSFSGLTSQVEQIMYPERHISTTKVDRTAESIDIAERRFLAREAMKLGFEHVVSRVLLHLSTSGKQRPSNIVMSGGVAANRFFRHVLAEMLAVRGHGDIQLNFPPLNLCTDNALMIAWAGYEMWNAGWFSDLDVNALRRWSMDPKAEDGGILGAEGWRQVERPTLREPSELHPQQSVHADDAPSAPSQALSDAR